MNSALLLAAFVSLVPMELNSGYEFPLDPCVEALRGAMERAEPFLPHRVVRVEENHWQVVMDYTEQDVRDLQEAVQIWQEVKLQCWRH